MVIEALMLVLGLLGVAALDEVDRHRHTITCDCGHSVARDVIVIDEVDARRIARTLTEGCQVCRVRAAKRNPDHLRHLRNLRTGLERP